VCEWINGRDDADDWDAAFATDPQDITSSSIRRKLTSLGYGYKAHTVEKHRNERHRVTD
jgi:hypothetical protein